MSNDPYRQRSRDPYEDQRQPAEEAYGQGNPWQRQKASGPSIAGGLLGALLKNPKVLAMLGMLVMAGFMYFSGTKKAMNPFTNEEVRIALTPEQEVAMGRQSVPQMLQEFGGEIRDVGGRERVLLNKIDDIGARLVAAKERILQKRGGVEDYDYPFDFHVLADDQTINAFALPGGQVFITMALLNQLPSEDAVAGVLGHEIGHVLAWHSNKQMAKDKPLAMVMNAVAIGVSGDSGRGGQIAQMVGQVIKTKYGRGDESQSDQIGVQLMLEAGYKPEALLQVMEVLKASMKGPRPPEMLSSHPFPETRAKRIEEYIEFFAKNGAAAVWTGGHEN